MGTFEQILTFEHGWPSWPSDILLWILLVLFWVMVLLLIFAVTAWVDSAILTEKAPEKTQELKKCIIEEMKRHDSDSVIEILMNHKTNRMVELCNELKDKGKLDKAIKFILVDIHSSNGGSGVSQQAMQVVMMNSIL